MPHRAPICETPSSITTNSEQKQMTITLHQFPFSHYNEKARWALAWKGVKHVKTHYLPGLHAKPIQQLSGQTQTPVLEIDGNYFCGSDAIVAALEERFPERPMLPSDADQRREARALEQLFDQDIGIPVRAVLFSILIDQGTYIAKLFSGPQPLPKRIFYHLVFPMAKGKVRAAYRTNDTKYIQQCVGTIDQSLDFVASRIKETGHLVGNEFTLADLSAAALLAPIFDLSHPDMRKPEPIPQALLDFTKSWRAHAVADWVNTMYRDFR